VRYNNTSSDNAPKISPEKIAESDAIKKRLSKVWWMLMIGGTALLGLSKIVEDKKKERLKGKVTIQSA